MGLDEVGARARPLVLEVALVGDLTAAGGVEGRLAELGEKETVLELLERTDLREHVRLLEPDEIRGEAGAGGELGRARVLALRAGPRALALLTHETLEAFLVDRQAPGARAVNRHLDRIAVRVVELEGRLARDGARLGLLLEEPFAELERPAETPLLGRQHLVDHLAALDQLGVGVAHLLDDHVGEPGQEVTQADVVAVDDRAPNDPAQDVAATLVARPHAVGDHERHPTPVVGKDAVRLRGRLRLAVRDAALGRDPLHDRLVAVGLVDRENVLKNRRGALEAHAGVDVLLGQRGHPAVGMKLVLHEHEVPELQVALARAAGRAFGAAAADALAAVVEELRVRATGAWAPDRPEVVGAAEPHDALRRQPLRLPEADRFLVLAQSELGIPGEHRHREAIEVDLHVVEDELPGEVDRAFLEVLPEREVAEHLEEGEVVAVEPDLVDVRRAEAFLHGHEQRRRGLLAPEEVRHQRLHARAVQQGRAIPLRWDERTGGVPLVPLRLEEGQEAFAQLGSRFHGLRLILRGASFATDPAQSAADFFVTIGLGRRLGVPVNTGTSR